MCNNVSYRATFSFQKQFCNCIFLNNVHHAESAKDIKYQTDKYGGASSALSNLNSNKKIHYFYLEISISAIYCNFQLSILRFGTKNMLTFLLFMFLLFIYTLVRVQNVCLPDNRTKRAVSKQASALKPCERLYIFSPTVPICFMISRLTY